MYGQVPQAQVTYCRMGIGMFVPNSVLVILYLENAKKQKS
jgi:hypothetical protein